MKRGNAGAGLNRRQLIQSLAVAPLLSCLGQARAFAPADSAASRHLSGIWRRALDPLDQGTRTRWYERVLPDALTLPGSLEQQRLGNPVTLATPWVGDNAVLKAIATDQARREPVG